MNITKNLGTCKHASTTLVNSIDIGSGNIIPHWWYQKILTTGDKADTMAIAILSELWFLYRSTGKQEHQKDYSYFCNKFSLSQYQVREAFIRLEALNIMRRSVGTIELGGRRLGNTLFVTLHVKTLLEMSPSSNSLSNYNDVNCIGNNDTDDNTCKNTDNDNFLGEDNNQNQEAIFLANRVGDSKGQELNKVEARINKNKIRKNRSKKSNFVNLNSNSIPETERLSPKKSLSVFSSPTPVANKERFIFASFYPLDKPDIDTLQTLCGREFSGQAINEILKNFSIKLPSHTFPHKAAFIKYMGKALTYEMRDAVKISNEDFRIVSNATSQELMVKVREEYLNTIEKSRDTSRQLQLRRKLAGVLEPSLAYSLLNSASFVDNEKLASSGTGSDSGYFRIILCKKLELSESEYQQILTQVRLVYGKDIEYLDITLSKTESESTVTTEPLFNRSKALLQARTHTQSQFQVQLHTEGQIANLPQMQTQPLEGIWDKVRRNLIEHYGSMGIVMDNAWFSKLTADVDYVSQKLTLKAPTKFIKDWVQNNYLRLINQICLTQNYNLIGVSI